MTRWNNPGSRRKEEGFRARYLAEAITGIYLACGFLWMLAALHWVNHDLQLVLEDSIYIVVTAALLYVLLRRGIGALRVKEVALRESEDWLARILETNASGIVVFGESGEISYANHAASVMLGEERSKLIGKRYDDPAWQLTAGDGTPLGLEDSPVGVIRRSLMPVYDQEFGILRWDGSRIVLSTNAAPLLNGSGKMTGIVASFVDITERKKVEEMKVRKLLLAVEQSPSAIAISDLEGNLEYANRRYLAMYERSPGEVGKRELAEGEGITAGDLQAIRDVVRSGQAWRRELMCRRGNGEVCWETVSVTPIRTAEGEVANLLWIREDITEPKRAEELLRASEERFRQLFEQNEEPLFICRHGSPEILDANPAAVDLYGFPRQELVGQSIGLFAPEGDREALAAAIAGIRPDAPLAISKARHRRNGGEEVIVSIRAKSVRTREGLVAYCSFRDITGRIRMEDEAKIQQAKLIHANRMAALGAIVSGVAHEVNNPNNLVMFNAPLIRSAWEDAVPILDAYERESGAFTLGGLSYAEMREALPKLVAGITDASWRIKGIVGNLKDFARQDQPRGQRPERINDVVRAAVTILNHEIMKRTRRFEMELADDLPAVMASAQQLEQVVINLLQNALQALSSRHQSVRVRTVRSRRAGDVEIHVVDEGIGMSQETLARIMEPFFSTRLESGGLGLGLSICQSIVKSHGGELCFESDVGKGTRAVIQLPAYSPSAPDGASDLSQQFSIGG